MNVAAMIRRADERRREQAAERLSRPAPPPRPRRERERLTPGQHILHLLLTVLTGGLWAPVWIWRALRGNRPYVPPGVPPGP